MLPEERISAVQTGGCPHTAIRDDITANLEAVEELEEATGPLDLVFVESGGDNLTAIFSPALADVQIFVIDVAGGDDIPRKGGPGIARADLLVINKTDLAPYVGSDVEQMVRRGVRAPRRALPVAATSLRRPDGAREVADWVRGKLAAFREHGHLHSSAEGVPDHHHDTSTTAGRPGSYQTTCTEVVVEDGRVAVLRPGPRLAPRVLAAGRSCGSRSCPSRPARWTATTTGSALHVGAGARWCSSRSPRRSRCPAPRASTSTRPSKAPCCSTSRR